MREAAKVAVIPGTLAISLLLPIAGASGTTAKVATTPVQSVSHSPAATTLPAAGPTGALQIDGRKTIWRVAAGRFGTTTRSLVKAKPCLRVTSAKQRLKLCVITPSKVQVKHGGYRGRYNLRAKIASTAKGHSIRLNTADLMLQKGRARTTSFCKSDRCSYTRKSLGAVQIPARRLASCQARSPWFFSSRNTKSKVVSLTLDDGPSKYTNRALRILKAAGVPATFFVVGVHAKGQPKKLRKIRRQGHVLANHTYSHPNLAQRSSYSVSQELSRTSGIIKKATGFSPCAFRAPYGENPASVISQARQQGMVTVRWNAGAHDYLPLSASRIVADTMSNTRPGSIILLHDGGGNRSSTLAALPTIIKRLRDKGYRFVNIPDMLKLKSTYQ